MQATSHRPPAARSVTGAPRERTIDETYRTLAPAVLGYFRSHGTPDPEDLVSEVFVGVARGLSRFQGDDDALRRWVFTIARRRLIDQVRRRAARPYQSVADPPELPTCDQPDGLDLDLVRALGTLTPLQREVVVLRFVGDLPLAAVARIVRRQVGAVKALQSRALDQLARQLGLP